MSQLPTDDPSVNHRYALCIGIGQYTELRNRNLRYAVKDAATIAERLHDTQRGNFAVTLLTEPVQTSKTALDDALDELLNAPDHKAGDLVLIYFSCHGDILRPDDTFCLLPSNATLQNDATFKKTTVLGIYDLTKLLSGARERNIIVLLDVCHSGGAGVALQHLKLDLPSGPNLFIIGAARQDQVAMQSSQLEHGIFTHCLLRAFEQPPTKDGWLTISQVQSFVSSDISWFAKDQPIQIQAWSVSVNPNLPLLRNPGYPELCPLPPLWNVPLWRNSFFTGQDDLLSQLASMLQSEQKTALTQPHAISGLGGIGKTQLALEYAYRHRQDYHAVLWGRADTREALISTFVSIAHLLDLPQKDEKDQMITVEAVKAWLSNRSKWLFILDNADELAIVKEFIPPAFRGHLLLTTRAQVMGKLARKIEVEVMQPEIGALLLLRRAGLIAPDSPLEQASPADVMIAKELSEEMGGLPLALDQAGAYIEAVACSLQDYEQLYQARRAELLKERGGVVSDYPESVATTWSLAFRKVKKGNPAASDLLRLCAFLHPDAIPEEIITKGAEHLGTHLQTASDPLALDKAIAALRAYSLLHRDTATHTLTIHRLVQVVLKDKMKAAERHRWAERAMLSVNAAFPHAEHATWSQCERLLPHALLVAQLTETYHLNRSEAGRLLYETAFYLQDHAYYQGAEPLFQQALRIWEQTYGLEHPQVTYPLHDLAILYREQGKYAQAEPLFQRTLHIREQIYGPDHTEVAYPLNNLANLYRDQGKYAQAEPLYQQALHIWEQTYGPEHPEMSSSLTGLAILYYEQGKYAQAEPLYQQALHIWEQTHEPEHPDVAYPLTGLADVYRDQGKYEQAEPIYQRALHILEQTYGPDHPNGTYPLTGLANLYREQSKYALAKSLYQRALHIREQTYGPDHTEVAYPLTGLANLYREQSKYVQAEPLYQRALHIWEQAHGPNHPLVTAALNNLANLYRDQGKYAQAEPLFQRALHTREQVHGPDHPLVAFPLTGLAILYYEQGKYEQAEPLYQRALPIRERQLGPEHPVTITIRENYHALVRNMKREGREQH